MRALERDRDRRFASAAEMARALDEFVVASKLHIDDVAALRARRSTGASVAAAGGGAAGRRSPGDARARPAVGDVRDASDGAPRAGGMQDAWLPQRGRARCTSRPRTALARRASMLAVLGVGTAFGLQRERPPHRRAKTRRRRQSSRGRDRASRRQFSASAEQVPLGQDLLDELLVARLPSGDRRVRSRLPRS